MSPRRDKTVVSLAEKYKSRFPRLERPILRKLIRLENPDLFRNPSNLRKLDRTLGKLFEIGILIKKKNLIQSKSDWIVPPKLEFYVTQNMTNSLQLNLPKVCFFLRNKSDYAFRVKLELRVILGGKNLGLIEDNKGYYNGKSEIGVEPGEGYADGNFTIFPECVNSDEELTIEVRATAIDYNKDNYNFLPKSWTLIRATNQWYYEPKGFTKGAKM